MEDDIIADLKESYGITCSEINQVTGGWLNQKWKVSTDKGELLVKKYNNERFSSKQLEKIESALQRHIILEKNYIPCPFIWQYRGRAIRLLNDETAYMVMDFCSGKTEDVYTITMPQMHSLGSTCGLMHKALSELPLPLDKSLSVYGGYTMDLLWDNFNSCMMKCSTEVNVEYREALLATEPILKQLGNDYFEKFSKGFAHEDFHSGNILFDVNCVSAVIDFDRSCFSYIWHDIGRAILSFALEGNVMNVEKVGAFLQGYSQHSLLTLPDIVDALRLTWCIEIPWWIQPEFFGECDELPKRFKDEMLWLTEYWFELESILCSQ